MLDQEVLLLVVHRVGKHGEPSALRAHCAHVGELIRDPGAEGEADRRIESVVVVARVLDDAEQVTDLDGDPEFVVRDPRDRLDERLTESDGSAGKVP